MVFSPVARGPPPTIVTGVTALDAAFSSVTGLPCGRVLGLAALRGEGKTTLALRAAAAALAQSGTSRVVLITTTAFPARAAADIVEATIEQRRSGGDVLAARDDCLRRFTVHSASSVPDAVSIVDALPTTITSTATASDNGPLLIIDGLTFVAPPPGGPGPDQSSEHGDQETMFASAGTSTYSQTAALVSDLRASLAAYFHRAGDTKAACLVTLPAVPCRPLAKAPPVAEVTLAAVAQDAPPATDSPFSTSVAVAPLPVDLTLLPNSDAGGLPVAFPAKVTVTICGAQTTVAADGFDGTQQRLAGGSLWAPLCDALVYLRAYRSGAQRLAVVTPARLAVL